MLFQRYVFAGYLFERQTAELWTPGILCKKDSLAIHLNIWTQLLNVTP